MDLDFAYNDSEAAAVAEALIKRTPLWMRAQAFDDAVVLYHSVEGHIKDRLLYIPSLGFDTQAHRWFICSHFNERGQSYRSPWTFRLFPAHADEEIVKMSPQLRSLEEGFNRLYDAYRHSHFDGGVSSVFVWPLQSQDGFASAFLLRQTFVGLRDEENPTLWFSCHVIEATQAAANVYYKMYSSLKVLIGGEAKDNMNGKMSFEISKSTSKSQNQAEQLSSATDSLPHISVIGPMIEKMEYDLRSRAVDVLLPRSTQLVKDFTDTDAPAQGFSDVMDSLKSAPRFYRAAGGMLQSGSFDSGSVT